MTIRVMLKDVLTTLYIGMKVARNMKNQFPDNEFFNGYLTCIKDRLTIPYIGTLSNKTPTYLYEDFVLWQYDQDLWNKYSEVLNCEEA